MHYLNVELKIIHRNLKGTNVFLNRKRNGQLDEIDDVRIGDFEQALHDDIKSFTKNRDIVGGKIISENFKPGTLGWKVFYSIPFIVLRNSLFVYYFLLVGA